MAGRPRKILDPLAVIQLASKGLNLEEIGASLNVSRDTIFRNYAAEVERGKFLCNASLRRKQFEVAMQGSETMLKHLGAFRLNQRDNEEKGGNTFNVSIVNLIERPDHNRNIDVSAISETTSVSPLTGEV